MIFQGLVLLLYIFAFAAGCMALVLSVVFHLRESYEWTRYLILFEASLLTVIILQVFNAFIAVFASDLVRLVFTYIMEPLIIADIAFLIVFIPYFASWILAIPWRRPFALISYLLSGIYIALRVLALIFTSLPLFTPLSAALFILALSFALGFVLLNLKNTSGRSVRLVAKTITIISLTMIPLVVLSLIFPILLDILYTVYYLSFNVMLIVFLFVYFSRMPHPKVWEPSVEDLKQFRITEREFSVILLIREGYTNKEIAEELSISVNTVNNHVANIFTKTEVRSRIDLLNLLQNEGGKG